MGRLVQTSRSIAPQRGLTSARAANTSAELSPGDSRHTQPSARNKPGAHGLRFVD